MLHEDVQDQIDNTDEITKEETNFRYLKKNARTVSGTAIGGRLGGVSRFFYLSFFLRIKFSTRSYKQFPLRGNLN